MSVVGSNWGSDFSRDGQLMGGSACQASTGTERCGPTPRCTVGGPDETPGGEPGGTTAPRLPGYDATCSACRIYGDIEPSNDNLDPDSCNGHVGRSRHVCIARGHRVLQRLSATCGPSHYALLGPVTCGELHVLSELLGYGLCHVQWLYVALQDPYRQGDFRQRATHALECLAGALAQDHSLKGLVLRLPQLKLDRQQLERVVSAFQNTLRVNTTLSSLRFKPSGCLMRADPVVFQGLIMAGKLSNAQRFAFLSGTLKTQRPGRPCGIQHLPQEVLQRILDACNCTVRND
eukprot:CAMPEP_0117682854 /NCGR_PEP_ID=MMETSP0804-20121206/19966_1 /TAXON_ID=1074897 /ORGANISM="Tetraselmis astigmatica, Strain CCMP880" /LENGTH=289 /DNA_ID=CAMNT_0005493163 /DNA_START=453 /DNA_END=1322 /DNA_ORIENTATION=+